MSDLTNKTLFLGDVSSFVTEAELEELFSQQGEVTEVKISGASRGISLCYGFVTMAERTQAEEAMEKLQGVVLGGRPIRINWAARNVRDKNSYSAMNDMINSVHVRYRTLQRMATPFTEENLTRLFVKYGKVVDASIKNSSVDQHNGIQRGYGFVHFEKTVEGMKAAMLAAANENGNSTVVLKCEVSKNLVKCSTYLAATINEGDPEAAAVALANGYPVMSSSPDDFKQELNGILPFVRPTIYNVEEIQEQYCDSPYYTSGDTSGASSPKMCYPHQPMMHTVYLTSCGPQGHQLMPQNSGEAYPSIVNGEYFPVEVQPGTCQQVYYPYQDQQHWAYHQVTNTLVSGGTTEEGSCGPTSPRSLRSNSDQFSYCYDGIVEGRPPPLQAEYNNHNNSPHQVAQKVAPHLSRTYPPPYRGYASQMRPSVNVHQAPLYVYQPNSLTTSPASSQRVFYPPPTPSSSYQYDKMSAQICYSPQVAQAVYFPQQNYQPQMYNIQGSYTYPGPGQGNMDMSYSPNSTIQSCSSYSSMADVNTSQKKGQIESMRQKSAATLEKLRTLI